MPVPDEFVLADDWCFCEISEKDHPLSTFKHVIITNDKQEKRYYGICSSCREKCRKDPEYEQYTTDKVFRLRLGRIVK